MSARLAVLLLGVLLLGACSSSDTASSESEDSSTGASPSPSQSAAVPPPSSGAAGASGDPVRLEGTRLNLTVDPGDGSDPRVWTLVCDPPGGDHPDPEAACRLLRSVGPDAFAPPRPDEVCTEVYGGPQTARVEGVVDGEVVDAAFARTNGCEIGRWQRLSVLFAVPTRVEP